MFIQAAFGWNSNNPENLRADCRREKMTGVSLKFLKIILLVACAGLCILAIFTNAIRFDMPIGYAGMYTSMSDELARANFILPQTASFYGPGGIPFAYPPLGFYLMALFVKMGVSPFFYLRYAPPGIGLAGLLVFFGLSRRIFSSTSTAILATLFASASPYLFESHIWAAGIVRGLAFVLFTLSFWMFINLKPGQNLNKKGILVGILAGFVALTHLAYVFFLFLWPGIWIVFHPKEKIWQAIPAILAGFLVTILPWFAILAIRYGLNIFSYVMNSHGTLLWTEVLGSPAQILSLLQVSISKLFETPLLAILAITGIGYQIYQKRYDLLALFCITALFNIESRRFINILGIMLAAHFLFSLYHAASQNKMARLGMSVVILLAAVVIYSSGIIQIQKTSPSITTSLIEVSKYISSETPAQSQYLFIADFNEAEWFPYLAQRTPIIAPWGGEWLGNLEEQTTLFYDSFACARAADLPCLEDAITRSGRSPDYFIMMKKKYRPLIALLEDTNGWEKLYNNREYQVWQRK